MSTRIKIKKLAAGAAAFSFAVMVLSTCRNPLQVGLGNKVDLEPPELAVTSHQNGDYLHGTETLAGTFADDLGINAVRVSLDDGTSFSDAVLADGTWTFGMATLDPLVFSHGDGEYECIVRAVDGAGKTLERRLLLYVDNHLPVVLIKVPTGYATGEYNGQFSIKGEAADQYGIARVELEVWNSAGTVRLLGPVLATGTSSWSYLFDSTAYNQDLQFQVTAYDHSDNPNTYLYHDDDVYAANGGTVTVEQVYQLDQGNDLGLGITPAELAALRLARLTLTVNQALDLPDFIISNPDEEAPLGERVLGSGANAIGMVLDDDGVDPDSLQISLDGGAFEDVDQFSGSGITVRWQHSLTGLGGGAHTLQLTALDIYGKDNTSNLVSFSIDLGAPTVEVTAPAQGSYKKAGSFLIEGTAFDLEGVASVKVSTNGGMDYYDATDTGAGFSTWEYTVAVPGDGSYDGNRTIKIMATDTSGKTGYTNLQVIVDTQTPTVGFLTPASSSTVNGSVLLKGIASDNTQVSEVWLKVGKNDSWLLLPGTYNWEYPIDSGSYASSTHSDETPPGSQVWKLTIQALAKDAAGNETTLSSYYLFIDNDMDKPTVSIVSPSAGQNLGGSVLVTGTAFDDDAVHHVEMQLDLNGDGDFLDSIDLNGDLDTLDQFEVEAQWYTVTGTTLWTQELNGSGELYQTEAGHDGDINLRLRAVDTKDGLNPDAEGNFQQLAIHFDDTIPRIENLNLGSGDHVKGGFTITGDVLDDTQITAIYISYDGGVDYGVDIKGDAAKVSFNTVKDYDLHIEVESTDYIATSGILYLRLKVVDNAFYQKIEYLNLNVDNVLPTGTYTGTASNIYGSTLNARLQGTAEDLGSVSGVQAVELYFIRGGTAHNPRTGATTAAGSKDFEDGSGTVPYATDAAYRIRIDNRYELGNDVGGNGDSDGIDESFTLSGSTYNWWAQFDSELIPDGAVDIHYVVYDQAGNGRHYVQGGFIKNNKPTISSVTVGSDVDATGTVEGDEQFTYAAPIQARNRLYIGINASDNTGGLQYAVYRDPGGDNEQVWTHPDAPFETLDISGYDEGATTFRCLVTDSDGIQTEATLVVTIANVDLEDPQLFINPLTQADAAGGHAELEGASLFHGGDPDISGVITLRGTASDNQRIGAITVTITNFDAGSGLGLEHTVATWQVDTLVSTDPNFVIGSPQSLTESGGHQITWTYTWNTANITGSAGKGINALFEVTDCAAPTARTDNYARGFDVVPYITSVTTTQTANGGLKENNIRSSLGRYSIKTGTIADFITIRGFNLNPVANGVRVSSATYRAGLDDPAIPTALMGNSLAVNAVSGDRTQVTVSNNTAASGYLTVVSGSPAAMVPSLNNLNDNDAFEDANGDLLPQLAEQYNREPDEAYIKNRLLTDDRYLDFFAVTDTGFSSSYFPNMLMSGDTPYWGYVQGGAANDLQVRRGTNSGSNLGLIRILAADQLALARDEDGLYHLVSVNNFNNGRMVYLYNIYETTPGYAPDGGATAPYWVGYGGEMAAAEGNNAIELDSVNYTPGLLLGRYVNPQLVVKGRSNTAGQYSRVYLGYYDQYTGQLLFRNFRVGRGAVGYDLYDTGRTNQDDTTGTSGDGARKLVSSSASQYFALGVTDDSRVVFVYFDQAAGKLRLTYSTAAVDLANPVTGTVTFAAPVDLPVNYVGWYVSLEVENDGSAVTPDPLHIAAYDTSDGDLRYLYLDSYADASPQVARVDANNSVGIYTSIKVRGGKPWIAYYNNSENGTRDSIKLARYLGSMASIANGAGADGFATGDWEYLTVPVGTPPQGGLTKFLKVNLDFNTSGDPILGYAASSIEYSRRLPEVAP